MSAVLAHDAVPRRFSVVPAVVDGARRPVEYLRLSVTDRCNLRCRYCLEPGAVFVPRREVLGLGALEWLVDRLIDLGVRKVRVTGGEPLARPGVPALIERLCGRVETGLLDEVGLSTNGLLLDRHAERLARAGLRRVNVSLDSLSADGFAWVTRRGGIDRALAGVAAATAAGLTVKINTVVMKGVNDRDIDAMIRWCGQAGYDLTLIELMPLGLEPAFFDAHFVDLEALRGQLAERWTLSPAPVAGGGPARSFAVAETGARLGFITPLSHGFCERCNRVRLTSTGRLYPCLGKERSVDLSATLSDEEAARRAIVAALAGKTGGHAFAAALRHDAAPLSRRMSQTGG